MSFLNSMKMLFGGPTVAIVHEFHRPPYGGGNQFLLALGKQLTLMGLTVGTRPGRFTRAVMLNSFNFDANSVRKAKYRFPNVRIVHRLAGPISAYRGKDIEVDRQTQRLNKELADASIFQSEYSAAKYRELALEFKNPVVIHNAADPDIFNPRSRIADPVGSRKVRIIATAWSKNPKKGGTLYHWLAEHLDYTRYELTFVGRIERPLPGAHMLDPVASEELADILRQHDIYITASEDDPCSNALIEALSCGLPVAFLRSGGHPELVGAGGIAFTGTADVRDAIDRIASNISGFRSQIHINTMPEVARAYLAVLGITSHK